MLNDAFWLTCYLWQATSCQRTVGAFMLARFRKLVQNGTSYYLQYGTFIVQCEMIQYLLW